eukprot:g14721.t1.1.5e17418c g14721  g14721.t1 contig90:250127-251213(-)
MIQLISPAARSIIGTSLTRRCHPITTTKTPLTRTFASIEFPHEQFFHHHHTTTTTSSNHGEEHTHSLLILGKPGGGKGTISGKILSDFPQFRHVSTGDELRQHVRNQTELGREAKRYMDQGALVPDNIMIRMVLDDAVEAIKEGQSLLLDGFPRTMEQAVALDKNLDVDMVINLCVPNETIIERISDRWIHPASGRVYSYSYKPPMVEGKDDETGEDLVQRDDDKPESVLRRLQKYDEATAPLVKYYEEKGGESLLWKWYSSFAIVSNSLLNPPPL